MNRHLLRNRRGMTLVDVIAAMGICLFLSTMVFGGLFGSREQANRVKCANNLRQIALAALMYSNADKAGAFPRTAFNYANPKLIVDTTGYGKFNSFDPKMTGENNVTASFYLLLKTQDITPGVFVCPSTKAVPGFGPDSKIKIEDSSNWESIPGNVTYSYSCPFPTKDAIMGGWKFNNTLGADFVLAAELNPGGDEMLKVRTPKSSKEQMKAGNSHNHKSEGQEVVYCDGHVEFQPTPFCGTPDDKDPTLRDNIYTYGGPSAEKGGDGVVGMPVGLRDSVLLPVGNAVAPAAGSDGK